MPAWLRTTLLVVAALLVGAAVAGVAVHYGGRARDAEAARQAEHARRLAAEARADTLARREAARVDSIARATAAALERLAAEQRRTADEARRLRERIPPPASGTPADSLRYWRATATAALAEVDALRGALATADSLRTVDTLRIRRLTLEAEREAARGDSLAASLARLSASLAAVTAERDRTRCRIVGLLPCPSRTTSALAGAVLTLTALQALGR